MLFWLQIFQKELLLAELSVCLISLTALDFEVVCCVIVCVWCLDCDPHYA